MTGTASRPRPLTVSVHDTVPAAWAGLLASDSRADYFHTAHWLQSAAVHQTGIRSRWLLAADQGRVLGGLALAERRTASGPLPWLRSLRLDSSLDGTSGGPIISEALSPADQSAVFQALTAHLTTLRTGPLGIATVSLNGGHEAAFAAQLTGRPGWRRQDIPAAVIPLDGGPDHVSAHLMKKSKRNERSRALRRGCEVFASRDASLLEAYYPIYLQASSAWGQAPTPLAFLQALLADPADRVFFTCVRLEGRVIGGHLNLHHGRRVIAWNGVTDPAFARSHFPATLAVWGDIVEACRRGAAELDLGASGGVVSLAGFKQHFGAREERRGFYRHPAPLRALAMRWREKGGGSGDGRRWHDTPPAEAP